MIRAATPDDFAAILALNAQSVHFLSPLDAARLSHLHAQAAYHRVIESNGTIAAFLLAFREGADYDSPNYRWFAQRYAQFLYIDRVVVASAAQGTGVGIQLYKDIAAFAAAAGIASLTCEYDLDPPNPVSARLHERFGFREVGRQQVGVTKTKQVSLQLCTLEAARPDSGMIGASPGETA
jgi:predicted GNAT superfamily acetyltransferase